MYGKGLLKGLSITAKHFFKKKITQQYPDERPVFPERFRGCLQFEFEKCIMCGMCARTCANEVLSLEVVRDELTDKRKLVRYTIDFQYCMYCNMCVEVCPKGCLSFNHKFELAELERDDLRIVYERPPEMDTPEERASLLYTLAGFKKPQPEVVEAPPAATAEQPPSETPKAHIPEGLDKKTAALIKALLKNPDKALSKVLPDENERKIMIEVMAADSSKIEKLAKIIGEDLDKAQKAAQAFVKKALRDREKGAE